MVRMFGRAARTLLTAGALGATLAAADPAAAQTPPRAVNSVQVTTSQMRLEAMKVEMALLADYSTYQLSLEVAVSGDGLELRGNVADDRIREQALRVARQACYMPVKDGLKVTTAQQAPTSLHTDAMRRTVLDVLQRSLGDRVATLDVQIGDQGQVVLTGEVPSVEDKLSASRSLKGMPGCQSVVNCLAVKAHQHSGHTLTMVTRDGQHAVHGQLPTPEAKPTHHTTAKPVSEPALESVSVPPPPTPTIPTAPPTTREVYVRLRTTNQPTYTAPSSGFVNAPATTPTPAPVPTPTPAPATRPSVPDTMPATTVTETKPQSTLRDRVRSMFGEPRPTTTEPTVAPSRPVPPTTPMPTAQTPPPVPVPPPSLVLTTNGVKWPPAHHVRDMSKERTAKPVLSNSPAIRIAARPELASKPGYIVSPPSVPKAEEPPPAPAVAARPATPTPTPLPLPVIKTTPAPMPVGEKPREDGLVPIGTKVEPKGLTPTAAKTSDPVPLPLPSQTPPAPSKATPALSASQVYNLVKTSCGKLASAVRVESGSDSKLTVHIHATPGSEQEIIKKLLAVPEIAASSLRMQIHLPQ